MTNRTFKSGESREQPSLFPPRIEDYVGPDNPVRAIDSFVNVLDLAKLGFRHADRRAGVGQPPYDPSDLLKLYLYGYINQIRSSRRLEREACRNLELIWLLKNLKPGYRTIASFRKENWAALKTANRSFVLLLRELSLVGGTLVAVDGALFHGNASKDSIFTRRKLAKQIAKLDQEIEDYGKSLDANDATEARQRAVGSGDGNKGGSDVGDKMKELMAKRERARADLKDLEAGDKGQMSKTDSDARLLSKGDQTLAGYNVQSVVDDKHKLIVASEVVNRSDAGHLHEMAKAAKEILEAETLQILADAGYYNSEDLKACEDDGIEVYVPPHEGNGRLEKQDRFVRKDFSYDAATNTYRCPAGQLLHPTKKPWMNTSGRIEIRYLGSKAKLRLLPIKGILSFARGKIPERQPLGARRCSRSPPSKDGRRRRRQIDAPPLCHRRTSLRDAQMPCRLSALPCPRLRQGSWRMELDGALLQLHARAQHSRLRTVRRVHGRKGMCRLQMRPCFRSTRVSACFADIPG